MLRTLAVLAAVAVGWAAAPGLAASDDNEKPVVLLEAEQFADPGGWDLDQQFMDQMGSPYLLAHGLGVPVADAETTAGFPEAGRWRVWVRTKDWVAPWKAPGAPGKFQVLVNGHPMPVTFGTEGAHWHWQDGGLVEVTAESRVALHDLTGFEGRCDAVLFCRDPNFTPPNEPHALREFRRRALGLPATPEDAGEFDLVVVGGGIAGTCAALSAARNGLTVALVQDRPVLGGNGSSEVRVWPQGRTMQRPFRRVGEIVEELLEDDQPAGSGNGRYGDRYGDDRKSALVRAEPRITLFIERRVNEVEMANGRISAVVAQHIRTARRERIRGKLFADCTGDATVGYLAGADYEKSDEGYMGASNLWRVMDVADPKQVLVCECKDKSALATAVAAGQVEAPFPRCPWALDLSDKPFPGRAFPEEAGSGEPDLSKLGGWFWESGFDKDMISELELVRDLNFRAMYGAWDALKNVDGLYPNHRIEWAAFIAGKRESRRLLGDVVLTGDDIVQGREWPDPAFPITWAIDVHTPDARYSQSVPGEEFISRVATRGKEFAYRGPYWVPYRCLYSRNIPNLFMAGRDISVDRHALGAVRVMRTCGMMGEIIGKAAWISVRHDTSPRGVFEKHRALLRELMEQAGVMRRESLTGPLILPPGVKEVALRYPGLDPAKLPGLIVDDEEAELSGDWSDGGGLKGFVGYGYCYSSDARATARFPIHVKRSGLYEVRVAWQPHPNRAKAAVVRVESPSGTRRFVLDQTRPAGDEHGFHSLGRFRLEADQPAAVVFDVANARGFVHVDAVQVVPVPSL